MFIMTNCRRRFAKRWNSLSTGDFSQSKQTIAVGDGMIWRRVRCVCDMVHSHLLSESILLLSYRLPTSRYPCFRTPLTQTRCNADQKHKSRLTTSPQDYYIELELDRPQTFTALLTRPRHPGSKSSFYVDSTSYSDRLDTVISSSLDPRRLATI